MNARFITASLSFALGLCILNVPLQSIAQTERIAFEKYGVAEGLPEEYVSSVIQDDLGFIWCSTQNGLVKYDGYQFKVYKASVNNKTHDLKVKSSLGGLLKTKDGKIWMGGVGTFSKGIASYDPKFELFNHYSRLKGGKKEIFHEACYLYFEDHEDNIWFLNFQDFKQNSICRLDAKTKLITAYPYKVNREIVNSLLQDGYIVSNHSGVWIIDQSGNLLKWNKSKDQFFTKLSPNDFVDSKGKKDTVLVIVKGKGDNILLSSQHRVYVLNSKTLKITHTYDSSPDSRQRISPQWISHPFEDRLGRIWISQGGGDLTLIDPVAKKSQIYTFGKTPLVAPNWPAKIKLWLISAETNKGLWFRSNTYNNTSNIFLFYDYKNNKFLTFDYNFNDKKNLFYPLNRYKLLIDNDGLLWLGTRPNLYKQSPKTRQIELYKHEKSLKNSLPSDTIRQLFADSKGRLWVGTNKGLALYQQDSNDFQIFQHQKNDDSSISDNVILEIKEDHLGRIWVATQNGLNRLDESNGQFKRYFYKPKDPNICLIVKFDRQKRVWTSILKKGVFVLDLDGKVLKSYFTDEKSKHFAQQGFMGIYHEDTKGNFWIGSGFFDNIGLFKLNNHDNGFTHFMPVPNDPHSIISEEPYFLIEDKGNNLWIGTDGGICIYDHQRKNFKRFEDIRAPSIGSYAIDKNGKAWFWTYSGAGLVNINPQTGHIKAFGEEQGLLQNDNTIMLPRPFPMDDEGRLYLPTQRGLSIFDPEKETFSNFFEKDGFQPYCREYAGVKTSNGDIWIGGLYGLNRITPKKLFQKDTSQANLVVTGIAIQDSLYELPDRKIFKQTIPYTKTFKLKHWQKDLNFHFVALHYLRSEENQYSWKLENYDETWSKASRLRNAKYTNLAPGTYVFKVKAANADGVWNKKPVSIAFTIRPPWWQSTWAYGFYVVFLFCAIFAFGNYRAYALKRANRLLEEKVALRTKQLNQSLENLQSTQAQLIQSEKLASLGELTAGIAHEIQNPLNFVNNFAEVSAEMLLEMDAELDKGDVQEAKAISADLHQNLHKINHHGQRASSIVKGMLEHSRASTGVKEPTDLNALADEYLRLAYHGLRAKDNNFNATMETHFDPNLPKVSVIPQDIGRVLLNLINNAFYAVTEKAKEGIEGYQPNVSISTRRLSEAEAENAIEIRVEDNGNGIPEAIKEKIFQPFFTTKPTGQGTGLGLSLAFDIVTKGHQGTLDVKSKEGAGTEFVIRLA